MKRLVRLGSVKEQTKANQATTLADGAGAGVCPGGSPTYTRSYFGPHPC
jgi:hypothetical protein